MIRIKKFLEKHLKRILTDDEILILNTAYSWGKNDSFKTMNQFINNQLNSSNNVKIDSLITKY